MSRSFSASAAFGAIGFAALTPFARDEFDLSGFGVGGIMGLIFVGALIATIPGGRLTDRVRPGHMLGATLLVQAAALGLVAAAPTAAVFFFAIAIVGVAMGAGDPSTNVLVSSNVPARRRGLLMGVNYGLNKVRFINAVPAGARVRATAEVADVTLKGNAVDQIRNMTVEIEG